jgi:hypothetical protein
MGEISEYAKYRVQLNVHLTVRERNKKGAEDYARSIFQGMFAIYSVVAKLKTLKAGKLSEYLVELKLGTSARARNTEEAEGCVRIQFGDRFNIDSVSAEETASEQEG